ncbi:MAG: hypothetical protein EAZ55_10945 [Cytophagales bacterium]|nr:MAG: hypothetical protein EAZ55_10945 [Cytophagales bacterium]
MKNWQILFFLSLISHFAIGQVNDNFNDDDFSNNPTWQGDVSDFIIDNKQLRSNGSSVISPYSMYLSTPNTISNNTEWQFLVDLKFNPTSTNLVRFFLLSDNANLKGSLKGYCIEIGQTSSDNIKLVRIDNGTPTTIFTGLSSFASNVLVRIKVIRSANGSWYVLADNTGGYNFLSEGSPIVDNTYNHLNTTFSHFGVLCNYNTTTRFNQFYFDDVLVGLDNTAPTIQKVNTINNTQLEVYFSEPVELISAQNTNNYFVNNAIGNPLSAVRNATNTALVLLTFTTPFTDQVLNTLSVSQIKDISENIINTSLQSNFYYLLPYTAQNREIVINEIMADPTNANGVIGLPDAEYVELFNASNRPISLQNWTLEGTGTATLPFYVLPPKGFVTLCNGSDVAKFSNGTVLSWGTGSLTNTGEELILKNELGQSIDRFTYTDDMYRDNTKKEGAWSLEQINPFLKCSEGNNWSASTNNNGGTPNAQNSLFSNLPDTKAPFLQSSIALSNTKIQLSFNEAMDFSTVSQTSNYLFSPTITINNITLISLSTIELTLSPPLTVGVVYTLQLNNLKDCNGNLLNTTNARVGLGFSPAFQEILITEIFADESPKVGLPEREYIEIYNPTNKIINLENCILDDGSPKNLPKQVLFPQEYAIICNSSHTQEFTTFGKTIGISSLSLTNAGEQISFYNPSKGTVFSIEYSDEWYGNSLKKEGGYSLEMVDLNAPCVEKNNWTASQSTTGGSPAQKNTLTGSRTDQEKPLLLKVIARSADTLEVFFSEKMDSSSLAQAIYTLTPSIGIQKIIPLSPQFKSTLLKLQTPITINNNYTLSIERVSDCSGNVINSDNAKATFGLPTEADSSNILLNEVLFNPRPNGSDFIELYNYSDRYINLKNWALANIDERGQIENIKVITTTNLVMAPKEYLALSNNPDNIRMEYPQSAQKGNFQLCTLPSLNDDKGTVVLLDAKRKIMELFQYDEDFHFDLLDDPEGVSLERLSWQNTTNNPNNWFSASTQAGYATPSLPNSQSRAEIALDRIIRIEPPSISPDGDGWQDFTTLQFGTEVQGYLATIVIFDKNGREIKALARNVLLGNNDFYTWDGSTATGERASLGLYIIYIELFDSKTGEVKSLKKSVAVGMRF